MSQADADRLVALLAVRDVHPASVDAGLHGEDPGKEPSVGMEPRGFSPGDWDAVIALAARHNLAPWLGARLKSLGITPPGAVAEQLDDLRLASAAQNMRLFERLGAILCAFEAAGIPVVPLKGAWLAKAVYSDAALRPMGDVDLWVPRPRIDAARLETERLGYAARARAARPQALQDALTGETQMWKAESPVVELHWNIFPGEWVRHSARIDEQAVWDRTVPAHAGDAPAGGGGVRHLAPEDAVIHLCVHLAVNHQMSLMGLRTLVDLDCARRRWTVDWGLVARRARAWRVAGAVWIVLHALAELLGDPAGELPLAELGPPRWRQRLLMRVVPPRSLAEGLELRTGRARFLLLLALVDRPTDVIRLAWRTVFPDRVWLTLRYGAPGASAWLVARLRLRHVVGLATRGEV